MSDAPTSSPGPAPMGDLAHRLLDAQVEWVLTQVTGERLAAVIERDIDDVLAVGGGLTLADVLSPDSVKHVVRLVAAQCVDSPVVRDLVGPIAEQIYDLSTADDHVLGDVVDRDAVEALIAKFLAMRQTHERVLDRLTESPLVATVAARFVGQIVTDVVQQNRARAEKVPGMSSLFSIGTSAASRVRSATDGILGDAAERSAAFALRRTNSAVLELLRDAPVQGAAMEIWDLHAGDSVGALREYLTRDDTRELAELVHDVVASALDSDYAGEVFDACVEVVFAQHASTDLATLLSRTGISRDDLVEVATMIAPGVIDALLAGGVLEAQVRKRLAPFFASPAVAAVLAE